MGTRLANATRLITGLLLTGVVSVACRAPSAGQPDSPSQGQPGELVATVQSALSLVTFTGAPATVAAGGNIAGVTAASGSGFAGGGSTACVVATNNSNSGGTCTVSGTGVVAYHAGATDGVIDTIAVTDHAGNTAAFTVTVRSTVYCASLHTVQHGTVTGAGGSAVFTSCTINTNTSASTCTINGAGALTYTAGPTTGYYIVPQSPAPHPGSYYGGSYFQIVTPATGAGAGIPYVEAGGAAGLSSLWTVSPSGSGLEFNLAYMANTFIGYTNASANNLPDSDLVANLPSATAVAYTMTDCNGVNDPGLYNRYGFVPPLPSGSNPYWRYQGTYTDSNNHGNGTPCNSASNANTGNAFYLVPAGDVLTIVDNAAHTGHCTIAVETPISFLPSSYSLASSTAIPAQSNAVNALQVWGGSQDYATGSAGCSVMTNASGSVGGCSVTGSGQVSYTAGAGSGTDVLLITDSQGNTGTVNITVAGAAVTVAFTVNPVQQLPPKITAVLTVSGGSGLTWSLVNNNSGGSINAATGLYTAGATGNVSDLVSVTDGTHTATVVIAVGPPITITPSPVNVKPLGAVAFTATGGKGSGYTWSFTTNASTGTINAGTGAYVAGAIPGTDVIKVVDTLGNQASVSVTVLCGADSSLQIIYPYNKTVFPLGMLPPIIQWRDNGTATYAKVTLQYPATGTPIFQWSEIVNENGALSTPYNLLPTAIPVTKGGRAQIAPLVWTTFQSAAAGNDALISVQALETNQGTLPATITVHFATAQLKGTIYYNAYDTSLVSAGAPSGATLAIQVGASTPTVVDGNTACRECHTVSASGNRLLTNDGTVTNPAIYESELSVALPAATETTIPSAPVANDGRFSWAAVSPDGTMMFTNAGSNQGGSMSGQWNNASTPYYSGLYSVSTGATLATSNFPAGLQALFPTFATDMAADGLPHGVAFNYNSADGLSLATMNATWGTPAAMKWNFSTPTVLFTPPSPPSVGSGTGDGAAVWPSYMPAGQNGIVAQNQMYFGCVEPGADGASVRAGSGGTTDYERNIGALGELWWVSTSGTPLPARLNQANGLGYLPTGPNGHGATGTTVPSVSANPTDTAGGMPTTLANMNTACGGTCGSCQQDIWNAVGPTGNDALENFKPTVNPQTTGGYQWVVFMSRRMYGNIGVINPYASDPREANEIDVGATPRYPSPKKLWVAAMSTNPAAGSDPSYPAFYLDGQELYSGNSRGYWVLPQCIIPSATRSAATVCTSSQDCCSTGPGTPAACTLDIPIASNPPTKHCVPNTAVMCSADGAACNIDGDCCNFASEHARCSGGICQIPPPSGYPSAESVSYDFVGTCAGGVVIGDAAQGQSPLWKYILTDQIVPAGTSIGITLQTAPTEAGLTAATPATPYSLTTTITQPMTLSSPLIPMGMSFVAQPVDQYLRALSPPQASQLWLRVTVTLNASANMQSAPTLQSLQPTFDCAATE